MNRSMEQMCNELLETAIQMWERDGAVITTSFAIGHSRSLFAQPVTAEGCTVDAEARVRIHARLAAAVGAVFLGRIDESFIAYRAPEDEPLRRGDLERLAETDPTIKTALVVQAMDASSHDSLVAVGILEVGDDGEPDWSYQMFDDPEGSIIAECRAAVAIAEDTIIPLTDIQLREELREMGWTVADSDQDVPDEDE